MEMITHAAGLSNASMIRRGFRSIAISDPNAVEGST